MFSSPMNPARAYAAVGLGTDALSASPHTLVSMLFEGASVAVASARMHQQTGQAVQKSQCIAKAVAILTDGLMASLDREAGGELADKLYAMYEYMAMRLSEANLGGGNAPLEEVGHLLAELHGAWKSIGRADKTASEPGGT